MNTLLWVIAVIASVLLASVVSVLLEDKPTTRRAEGLTTADVRRMAEESLRRPL